jgi:hypothetical protein
MGSKVVRHDLTSSRNNQYNPFDDQKVTSAYFRARAQTTPSSSNAQPAARNDRAQSHENAGILVKEEEDPTGKSSRKIALTIIAFEQFNRPGLTIEVARLRSAA